MPHSEPAKPLETGGGEKWLEEKEKRGGKGGGLRACLHRGGSANIVDARIGAGAEEKKREGKGVCVHIDHGALCGFLVVEIAEKGGGGKRGGAQFDLRFYNLVERQRSFSNLATEGGGKREKGERENGRSFRGKSVSVLIYQFRAGPDGGGKKRGKKKKKRRLRMASVLLIRSGLFPASAISRFFLKMMGGGGERRGALPFTWWSIVLDAHCTMHCVASSERGEGEKGGGGGGNRRLWGCPSAS